MRPGRCVICVLLGFAPLLYFCPTALAQPNEKSKTNPQELVVKEKKGIRFKLPADWPLEERDGSVNPVPVEEYLSQKFSAIDSRLSALERDLEELKARLRITERELIRRKGT